MQNAINEDEKTSLCLTLFRANLIRMCDVVNHQMNISLSHKLFRCVSHLISPNFMIIMFEMDDYTE